MFFPIKLDRSNYLIWKGQLFYLIVAYGVEEYVDDTKEIPERSSFDYAIWSCINGTIHSWIFGSISTTEVSGYLIRTKTAREL